MNLDYIAGFFDGEGCVIAKTRKNAGRETWWFRVTITQKDPNPLDMIYEYLYLEHGFDFKLCENKANGSYFLYIERVMEVERFLKLMLPKLIVKRPDALVALAAIENRPRKGERARETWANKKGAKLS